MKFVTSKTGDISAYYIKGDILGHMRNNYLNDVHGMYTLYFSDNVKHPYVKFKNGNEYMLSFASSSVSGQYFFYGSKLIIKGTKEGLQIKDIKICACNCDVYLELSEGIYGIPVNIICNKLYIVGEPEDLIDFYNIQLILAYISLIDANSVFLDRNIGNIIADTYIEDDSIYKIDFNNIEVINCDKEDKSKSKVLSKHLI